MKTLSRTESYNSIPGKVFQWPDDLDVTGMSMMGSKFNLEFITPQYSGLGSKYTWTGNLMRMMMDFTVEITRWLNGIRHTGINH